MAEERLTDDPVKKQRPEDGIFEVDGEEYDDDLVGLTPGKLEEELERRRLAEARARAERERLAAEAETKLAEGDFEGAASLYLKAAEQGYEGAETGFWRAKTKNYTDLACFYDRRTARAFACAGEEAREDVLAHMGSEIEAEEARCEEIAAPLREKVYAGMASRRDAFRENRNFSSRSGVLDDEVTRSSFPASSRSRQSPCRSGSPVSAVSTYSYFPSINRPMSCRNS